MLMFGSLELGQWRGVLKTERDEYERLREEFVVTRFPGDEGDEEVGLDPLLADEDSVSSAYL